MFCEFLINLRIIITIQINESINIMNLKVYMKDFIQNYDIGRGKKIACIVVVLCLLYHGLMHLAFHSKNESCKVLFGKGELSDMWRPKGCLMHVYSVNEAKSLLHNHDYVTNAVFVGHAHAHAAYTALRSFFEPNYQGKLTVNTDDEYLYKDVRLRVMYKFVPEVGSPDQLRLLESLLSNPPHILLLSGVRNSQSSLEGQLTDGENTLISTLIRLQTSTQVVWLPNDFADQYGDISQRLEESGILVWKQPSLFTAEETTIPSALGASILVNALCNEDLDTGGDLCCTSHRHELTLSFPQATIFVLSFISFTWLGALYFHRQYTAKSQNNNTIEELEQGLLSESEDTSKDTGTLTEEKAGVLAPKEAGAVANGDATGPGGAGGATGAQSKSGEVVQSKREATSRTEKKEEGLFDVLVHTSRAGLVLIYFILCDRLNMFMKENKHYTHAHFFLTLTVVAVLGIVLSSKSKITAVLHRDQTDEWKGWMQLVILIYHITGASQVLGIYMQIRVLVSAYLFMSGFGHFYFYFAKADYSLYRVVSVLYRCNILVVLLCFTMERPYQFYYFVPLVSFWFLVCYGVMNIWPQVSVKTAEGDARHNYYIVLKLGALVLIITLLYFADALFSVLFDNLVAHPFFALSDGTVLEWRFRWSIDRYSTVYGMVFALLLMYAKKHKYVDNSHEHNLFTWPVTSALVLVSAVGYIVYTLFTMSCTSKPDCNSVHAYISCVPILSFVVLRNVVGWVRIRFSYFFAWFGNISLELFIAQYHIWLASDTVRMLVLIPDFPLLNIIATTFVFVCVAHEIHTLTSYFIQFLVPKEFIPLIRNLVVFTVSSFIIIAALHKFA